MFKYILETAGNINWMAIAALLTFVTIFLVSTMVVLRRDTAFIDRMAHLPLEDTYPQTAQKDSSHEA
jgi:hypothetical protein